MGRDAKTEREPEAIRSFSRSMLRDLAALQRLIAEGRIDSGPRRIGMEQELFLADSGWRPAPVALAVLERLASEAFTTELALFNLEINLPPLELGATCFSEMERALEQHILAVREAARSEGAEVVLTGILPTLRKSDCSLESMTPKERYRALNEAVTRMRGGPLHLQIQGIDELQVQHDSVLLEACNTSCQVHLQVGAEEFARFHNAAQVALAPVLSAAVNSPLLFGKRLWAETRIALFHQSVDTRAAMPHLRERAPRVRFGDNWVRESVLELFEEDIARFRALLPTVIEEDPQKALDDGRVPKLEALQLHNSTIYRWNRPCYGIYDGRAHLRIECRALPAGPTVIDEIANSAFWIGSVIALASRSDDITERIDFDEAKGNFIGAARQGLNAVFNWLDGETIGARELVLDRMLPLAEDGLREAGVGDADIARYLDVIRERVESEMTGSQWILRSLSEMKNEGIHFERLAAIAGATTANQREGDPVHRWPPASLEQAGGWRNNYLRVEQYMTTDLFTVNEDELVDMVAFLMDRKQIRHVLVEDDAHEIVGLVSYRSLIRLLTRGQIGERTLTIPVKEVMVRDPVTITPETSTSDAIELMRKHRVSLLPVVKNGKLIGIVGERDFMPIARHLLEEKLREG